MKYLVVLAGLALLCGCQLIPVGADSNPSRTFHISYQADLTELPRGENLKLWVPIPSNDPHQVIRNLEIDAPWKSIIQEEPIHGNRMVYLEGTITDPEMTVVISYDVDRWENSSDLGELTTDGADDDASVNQYTKPSSLGIVDDTVRRIAEEAAKNQSSTIAKARAFYDHVGIRMVYDKSGQGWGRGDTLFACTEGRGNCTDFHSYFISLCQASGIPARFQIGLYGPYDQAPGETKKTGGYHCWAEFRVPGKRWVPVDISEGDKDPSRWEYFFGNHTDNRVTLSTGRDIVLQPKQAGPSLNYFVNPYAEVNGKPHAGVSKTCHWTDAVAE